MSGPKVLRTITREELLEIALVQQAIVDHMLTTWQAEVSDTDDEAPLRYERFLADVPLIDAAVNTGRPEEIVRRANLIVDAINRDIDQMRDVQYLAQAKAKTQARSLQFVSKSLLESCCNLQIDIPTDHLMILQQSATGKSADNEAVSRIAAHWMDRVVEREEKKSRIDLQELARSLMTGPGEVSATKLLEQLGSETRDTRIVSADKQIAELLKLGERSVAEQMEQRLIDLINAAGSTGSNQISLALDALGVEIASRVKKARVLNEVRRDLAIEISGATAINDTAACQSGFDAAAAAIEQGNEIVARERIREARQLLESRRQTRAAHATRNAILRGLTQLGYSVHEGMETSWSEHKHLVIQNPSRPGVALEMTGNSDTGRLQARIVALEGARRGSATDLEVETDWCQELQSLRTSLSADGVRIEIERAVSAGAQPLKVVSSERVFDELAVIRRQQQREMQ